MTPTLAACITSAGAGAIATLAVRGPMAWAMARELFRPRGVARPERSEGRGEAPATATPFEDSGRATPASGVASRLLPDEPEAGRFWVGRLGEAPDAGPADEVVLAVVRTGPAPWIEVHCHGGAEVVRWLLELLAARGVTVCGWQELERRTAEDPLRAAAEIALAHALTVRTAGVLLDQVQGALRRAVEAVLAVLPPSPPVGEGRPLSPSPLVGEGRGGGDEAPATSSPPPTLTLPHKGGGNQSGGQAAEATRLLDELCQYAPLGRKLTEPWCVAILGPPNVGKSSLVNALAGFQRCVVAPTPGTTRDVVTTLIAVDGWPVELADTAGLRERADDLEGQGIARARSAARAADLRLWVLDASDRPTWPEPDLGPVRLVVSKTDLVAPTGGLHPGLATAEAVLTSAHTGAGIPELCDALARWLVPDAPPAGAAVPFNATLCGRLEQARALSAAGRLPEAAHELERALSAPWPPP